MSQKLIRLMITLTMTILALSLMKFWQPTSHLSANNLTQSSTQIALKSVLGGFKSPVQVTHAGDDRLFVVEQAGVIRIVSNGAILPTPFLDISSLVRFKGERGLLGLAFHPNYQSNGFFYLNYTRLSDGATIIDRYQVSSTNPDQANPASATTILTVAQPYSNHNGGQLLFGPDGYLYIGMGDGGSGGDPDELAQNPTTLLGKMLRIDVDSGTPYAIPPDNPFVGDATTRDEIWALGLRNPWRFSFDRLTGEIYIGDVGQNSWEEIDYLPPDVGGVNFGWDCREGAHNFEFVGDCASLSLTDPIAEYSHTEGNSVTGGFVYRGNQYPALAGHYFYADYVFGKIWSIQKTGPNSWTDPNLELDTNFPISAFGEDKEGELYLLEYDSDNGTIWQIVDAQTSDLDLSGSQKLTATPHADPDEEVTYTLIIDNKHGPSAESLSLTDTIPTGLSYVANSFSATQGVVDDSQNPVLSWQGTLSPSPRITLTYKVKPTGAITGTIINQAQLSDSSGATHPLSTALFVPRPVLTTTVNDFFFPGTQPGQLQADIPNPTACAGCHTEPIYNRWQGSMMAQAGRDPLMWAALAIANNDAPQAGEYCLRCHTPKGWLEGRSHPATGSALQSEDIEAGVACEVCHRMVDPVPSSTDEAVTIDANIRAALPATATLPSNHVGSGMMIVDPEDNRRGPFSVQITHSAFRTDFLSQFRNAMTESRLCGTCHNVDNPVLSWDSSRNQYWPNGTDLAAPSFEQGDLFPIETTFDEWANSSYATTGVSAPQFAGEKPDDIVRSCQDCHMRRTTGQAAASGITRDCSPATGCLPEHEFVGANTWVPQILQDNRWRLQPQGTAIINDLNQTTQRAREMLRKSATLTATLTNNGTNKIATVRVTNETGHKLPTGYPEGRRMWLHLKAYDTNYRLLYESGLYDSNTGLLSSTPKIYEAKQGITPELADLLQMNPGPSFHFVLNNTVIKDNRIPPRGYTQAAFDRPGLRPVGATYEDGQYWDETIYTLPKDTLHISVTLYYQTASKEYIDFLREKGGLDGATLGTLWDTSKSPPEIVAQTEAGGSIYYFPIIAKDGIY